MPNSQPSIRLSFFVNGYVVIRDFLDARLVDSLKEKIADTLVNLSCDRRDPFPRQGSMEPLSVMDPIWAKLITASSLRSVIGSLGAEDIRWLSGYLISKPPRSPRLWWHQDWWAWQHDISCADMPAQLSVMIYPFGADASNGSLRVIPGTHRTRHPLHDKLPDAHSIEASSLEDAHEAYSDQPDKVSVNVGPRDVVFCDVRLLHSTHGNASNSERPCLTLWYLPDYSSLPVELKSHYAQHPCQPSVADRRMLPSFVSSQVVPLKQAVSTSPMELVRAPITLRS